MFIYEHASPYITDCGEVYCTASKAAHITLLKSIEFKLIRIVISLEFILAEHSGVAPGRRPTCYDIVASALH